MWWPTCPGRTKCSQQNGHCLVIMLYFELTFFWNLNETMFTLFTKINMKDNWVNSLARIAFGRCYFEPTLNCISVFTLFKEKYLTHLFKICCEGL